MTYHVHSPAQIKWAQDDGSGNVPDTDPNFHSHYLENLINVDKQLPNVPQAQLFYDAQSRMWVAQERCSKTFFGPTQPTNAVSKEGDLWLIT